MTKAKLILTLGLPASGKTTWAKEYCNQNKKTVILCRDDYRARIFGSNFGNKSKESLVTELQGRDTTLFLERGYSVIWADTNLNPACEERARALAEAADADFAFQDFRQVPLSQCMLRNRQREEKVPDNVVSRMYSRYLVPYYAKCKEERLSGYSSSLDKAIVVDVDGTVAQMHNRHPYEWGKVQQDLPRQNVVELVKAYISMYDCKLVFLTGRDGGCQPQTKEWLSQYFDDFELYSREANDNRADYIVKQEILHNVLEQKYDIKFFMDDRQQVVDMWRSNGYECLQVQPGWF